MSEVALAPGSAASADSTRRFGALRAAARALRRAVAAPTRRRRPAVTLRLRYRPPYDWAAMLSFLRRARRSRRRARSAGTSTAHDHEWRAAAATVEIAHRSAPRSLAVTVRFPGVSALPAVIARVRRVFDLAADVARDRRAPRRGPGCWRRSLQRGPGFACRAPGTASSWRCAPCSGSRSPSPRPPAGRALVARLRSRCRGRQRELTHVFPTPESLAADLTPSACRGRAAARSARWPPRPWPIPTSSAQPRARRGGRAPARIPGHRRMDRAVHRAARAARAGCLSGRATSGCCAAPRPGRPAPGARAPATCGTLAAVARLRRAAPLGVSGTGQMTRSAREKRYGVVSIDQQRTMSGLEFVQGLVTGTLPMNSMAETLGYDIVEASHGRAVLAVEPTVAHLNPAGTVHGGLSATLLDSCMGLAVHSTLEKGLGQTTLEFKISLVRPLTPDTGLVQSRRQRHPPWTAHQYC